MTSAELTFPSSFTLAALALIFVPSTFRMYLLSKTTSVVLIFPSPFRSPGVKSRAVTEPATVDTSSGFRLLSYTSPSTTSALTSRGLLVSTSSATSKVRVAIVPSFTSSSLHSWPSQINRNGESYFPGFVKVR